MSIVEACAVIGVIAEIGWAAFAAHLAWQVARIGGANPAMALRLFRSNRAAALLLFLGLALEACLRAATG